MGVSIHRGTPSHPPYFYGDFPGNKPTSYGGSPMGPMTSWKQPRTSPQPRTPRGESSLPDLLGPAQVTSDTCHDVYTVYVYIVCLRFSLRFQKDLVSLVLFRISSANPLSATSWFYTRRQRISESLRTMNVARSFFWWFSHRRASQSSWSQGVQIRDLEKSDDLDRWILNHEST